jgi:hypothetical protein
MRTYGVEPIKYDPRGEATRREQMRNADLDRIERNKEFPTLLVKGFGFRPFFTGHDTINIHGPLCPAQLTKDRTCLAPLIGDSETSTKARCEVCGKSFELPFSFQNSRQIAHRAYEGLLNSQATPITLDVPYDAVKAEVEDETRYVKVVWSQKNGRNAAVIYFIQKDAKGDKTQIFVDMDREEIRYDANDIPPGKILAKVRAEFPKAEVEITYNPETEKK